MGESQAACVFRLNDHGQGPELVRQVFLEKGWVEFEEDEHEESDWNLWWRTNRFRNSDYDHLMSWQRLNHYPRSTAITKKDSLARNMKRMRGVYGGSAYNFCPVAFNLPNDYTRFVAEYGKLKEKESDSGLFWICKPADLSRGRGIFIFKDLSELQYDCNAVVQQYLSNPMLISGYKFDLRIYVAVPSFHPLQFYIYEEGLVRFSTEKFDLSNLANVFAHLTNTSINKNSPSYNTDKERVGPGCKWTISQLRHYFHQANIDDEILWIKIINIVILTLVIQANQVPKASNCYELYGFDIIIDDNMKPWLLEVNFSPALSADTQTDLLVKKPMLHDLIDILHFEEQDKYRGQEHQSQWDTRSSGRPQSMRSHHRSTVSRLPNISNTSTGGGNSLGIPHPLTARSGGGDDEESDVYFAENQDIMPVIPGCGLPSVQHPVVSNLHHQHQRRPTSSSGRSSASSSHSSMSHGDGQSYEPMREWNSSKKRGVSQMSPASLKRSGSKGSHTGRTNVNGHSDDGVRNVPVKVKQESKVSVFSDSGISVHSGSSDNSEHLATLQDVIQTESPISEQQHLIKSWRSMRKAAEAASRKTTMASDQSLLVRSLQDTAIDSAVQNMKGVSSVTTVGYRYESSYEETDSKLSLSSNAPKSATARRHSYLTAGNRGNRRVSQSLVTNRLNGRSAMLNRRGSTGITKGPLNGNSEFKAQTTYAKPWRNVKTTFTASPSVKTSKDNPPAKVGDFILAFPFNEATRKCSVNNVDVKTVIRETQKLVKQRQMLNLKTEAGHVVDGPPVLWGPLKSEASNH